jgi:hypothetical protein
VRKNERRPQTTTNGESGKDNSSGNHSITRVDALVDHAALLADELATRAARTGRARYACAATLLSEAAHYAWRAAEALCEAVTP